MKVVKDGIITLEVIVDEGMRCGNEFNKFNEIIREISIKSFRDCFSFFFCFFRECLFQIGKDDLFSISDYIIKDEITKV